MRTREGGAEASRGETSRCDRAWSEDGWGEKARRPVEREHRVPLDYGPWTLDFGDLGGRGTVILAETRC